MTARIFLAENHTITRKTWRIFLKGENDFKVVGERGDGRTAFDMVRKSPPDVVVMEAVLSELNGVEATRQIHAEPLAVIVVGPFSAPRPFHRTDGAGRSFGLPGKNGHSSQSGGGHPAGTGWQPVRESTIDRGLCGVYSEPTGWRIVGPNVEGTGGASTHRRRQKNERNNFNTRGKRANRALPTWGGQEKARTVQFASSDKIRDQGRESPPPIRGSRPFMCSKRTKSTFRKADFIDPFIGWMPGDCYIFLGNRTTISFPRPIVPGFPKKKKTMECSVLTKLLFEPEMGEGHSGFSKELNQKCNRFKTAEEIPKTQNEQSNRDKICLKIFAKREHFLNFHQKSVRSFLRYALNLGKYTRTLMVAGLINTPTAWADLWNSIPNPFEFNRKEGVDLGAIPEISLKWAGEIDLAFHSRIELDFGKKIPGLGLLNGMVVSPEGRLMVVDIISETVIEFSLVDGRYIRSFGRKGNGPGEYDTPNSITIDSNGLVYLSDHFGIIRYDHLGNYLNKWNELGISRVLAGQENELFMMKMGRVMKVFRLDPNTWEIIYRIPVSTEKEQFFSSNMGLYFHLCYSATKKRLYYIGINDYQVIEIDANSGIILRRFGLRPEGFTSLPSRFHDTQAIEFFEEINSEITSVRSMTLLGDRYLFISHDANRPPYKLTWAIYDLDASSLIKVYDLSPNAKKSVQELAVYTPWNSITAWGDELYIWRPPSNQNSETSNGFVEVYIPSFGSEP